MDNDTSRLDYLFFRGPGLSKSALRKFALRKFRLIPRTLPVFFPRPRLNELPDELLLAIEGHLPTSALGALMLTCHKFEKLFGDLVKQELGSIQSRWEKSGERPILLGLLDRDLSQSRQLHCIDCNIIHAIDKTKPKASGCDSSQSGTRAVWLPDSLWCNWTHFIAREHASGLEQSHILERLHQVSEKEVQGFQTVWTQDAKVSDETGHLLVRREIRIQVPDDFGTAHRAVWNLDRLLEGSLGDWDICGHRGFSRDTGLWPLMQVYLGGMPAEGTSRDLSQASGGRVYDYRVWHEDMCSSSTDMEAMLHLHKNMNITVNCIMGNTRPDYYGRIARCDTCFTEYSVQVVRPQANGPRTLVLTTWKAAGHKDSLKSWDIWTSHLTEPAEHETFVDPSGLVRRRLLRLHRPSCREIPQTVQDLLPGSIFRLFEHPGENSEASLRALAEAGKRPEYIVRYPSA